MEPMIRFSKNGSASRKRNNIKGNKEGTGYLISGVFFEIYKSFSTCFQATVCGYKPQSTNLTS